MMKARMTALGCLLLAAAAWWPCVHLFFRGDLAHKRAALARDLAAAQSALWEAPGARAGAAAQMRRTNAEWDFMGRTFLVLSLANLGLASPGEAPRRLAVMDAVIDETLRLEREKGVYYFLMDYAREGAFVDAKKRSVFQDGEIALMLAARRCLAEREDYRAEFAARAASVLEQMTNGPVLCAESYPDECWMFCNAVGLAVLRCSDALDGTDHRAFVRRWLDTARQKLVDPQTGLLISKFTLRGEPGDGPEGSSIWMVAHCLQLVDPAFARDQYDRSRRELGRTLLGFGYAREWPDTWVGPADVDSGPVIPVLGISAGSSGMALIAAAAFGDGDYLSDLLTTLDFGGFPVRDARGLRYAASNQVGDAAMLYALVQGPLWADVQRRLRERGAAL